MTGGRDARHSCLGGAIGEADRKVGRKVSELLAIRQKCSDKKRIKKYGPLKRGHCKRHGRPWELYGRLGKIDGWLEEHSFHGRPDAKHGRMCFALESSGKPPRSSNRPTRSSLPHRKNKIK